MDVALNLTLYLAARVDVVHVGVKDYLEHHLRVVGTALALAVQFLEILEVKVLDYGIDNAHRVVSRYIIAWIEQKKQPVVVTVGFCM